MRIKTTHLLAGCFGSISQASICIHDRRLEKSEVDKVKREYLVPGYFYDHTVVSILSEGQRNGNKEFKPLSSKQKETIDDDHSRDNDEGGAESTGAYIMLALLFGVVVTILGTRLAPRFPSPLITLVFGISFAVVQRYSGTLRPDGEHFLSLDSEYVIFGLTPVLILGEILKLDVRLAKRLVVQFIFYGIVGGVVNTLLTMVMLGQVLPDQYGVEIRLCLAALISTADASFVGRILHRVGVPHRVILLIEGEGMANDPGLFALLSLGKVLYERIHLTTLKAVPTSFIESSSLTARIVLSGIALGSIIGILTLGLINITSNRFESENRILQIVITIVSCYATFFLAEGVFGMSGALSVVSSGWILAWKMWPKIISEQAMTAFWHSVGFISESLLYLVCGFYIGFEAFEVQTGACIALAFAIWGVALGCRFATLFLSWPIMNLIGPRVSARELCLWAWCSLKSRIGLALIIEFTLELLTDDHFIEADVSKRDIVFIIGSIFLISNMINGLSSGLVARALRLDRDADFEDTLKSVVFRNALLDLLRQNGNLAQYLKHTYSFAIAASGDHPAHSGDSEAKVSPQKDVSRDINWSSWEERSVVVAMRSIFLSVLRSLYWEENEANKISIRAVQALLTAVDHSLEEVEIKPIQDFYHLMIALPSRDALHSQYRVIYILTTFAEYHSRTREVIVKEILPPMFGPDGQAPSVLASAWSTIEKESQLNEQFARRELSLRFNESLIRKFMALRTLNIAKVERTIEKFAAWGLITDIDSEESHEAIIEDLTSIKMTLRAIGNVVDDPNVEQDEAEKLIINDSMFDVDVQTNYE
jgi:NhaP-type Na+/H+ or K+/H+ antiporter